MKCLLNSVTLPLAMSIIKIINTLWLKIAAVQSLRSNTKHMNNPTTITIAGKSSQPLTVNRLGYGTMRLTGEGIYGEPPRRSEALEILRQTGYAWY
jgi:hypothetical protein